jgi:hypothetical protein
VEEGTQSIAKDICKAITQRNSFSKEEEIHGLGDPKQEFHSAEKFSGYGKKAGLTSGKHSCLKAKFQHRLGKRNLVLDFILFAFALLRAAVQYCTNICELLWLSYSELNFQVKYIISSVWKTVINLSFIHYKNESILKLIFEENKDDFQHNNINF